MTIKTAAWVAVGLVGAAFLYAFVFQSYSRSAVVVSQPATLSSVQPAATPPSATPAPAEFRAPATPDTAVNDLIDEALADRDDLDAEVKGELSDLETDATNINNLNEVYDANEIQ